VSKRKHRREAAVLYESVTRMTSATSGTADLRGGDTGWEDSDGSPHDSLPISDEVLSGSSELSRLLPPTDSRRRELPRMKKFRFQLLHDWLLEHVPPRRAADVGGGKGLLAYLLRQSGWPEATVIDPCPQGLPLKYKDLSSDRQVRIPPTERVPRIDGGFEPGMARDFDLLIAMHAHGCNVRLIDAAAEHGCGLILLPCCVIGEPLLPPPGVHWIQCLIDHALGKGLSIEPFRLNFKGQNIGIYARGPGRNGPAPLPSDTEPPAKT
jgi:hypothetical protein